ncbi:MAG: protein-L-isoaspartate(D-aspartate) O-methyltransferase [Saprospiraceae bacterium]|nr:protein-L-isoaspartate(D-aspartate) O-methyltransferase [Saprospiraceae bacterium]
MITNSLICFLAFSTTSLLSQQSFVVLRQNMVTRQIKERGIENPSVLKAFRAVKRHLFVPPELRERAYDDRPLPIGYGQTISQPYIVAYMTDAIHPQRDFKVLEVGTGSGYQAAILAEIIDSVFTIEIVKPLAASAKSRLEKLHYQNIYVKFGDGYYGWKEHAPFDAIVVTAAADFVPPPLIEQLKEGGTLIIPVGSPFTTQRLMQINKKMGKTTSRSLIPVRFVPFTRE